MWKKWYNSKSEVDHDTYVEQTNATNRLINSAKEEYFKEKLDGSDSKSMYGILSKLLNSNVKHLPDCNSTTDMCNSFANFFNDKVIQIRKTLDDNSDSKLECDGSNEGDIVNRAITPLMLFNNVTIDDVCNTIMSTPSKSCTLDVLPMWLLKENIADLAKPLTTIINMSFSIGVFPTKLREARVYTPIEVSASL